MLKNSSIRGITHEIEAVFSGNWKSRAVDTYSIGMVKTISKKVDGKNEFTHRTSIPRTT